MANARKDDDMTLDEMWDDLIEYGIPEDAIRIVTNINGYKADTMRDILYSETGYRTFEQWHSEA